jgi:hypothetical protein
MEWLMARVINVSMPEELVEKVNRQAGLEDRPRSAIFREALRLYFEQKEGGMPPGHAAPPGSPQAVLAAFDTAPAVSSEDVDDLFRSIEEGKKPIRFDNPLKPIRRSKRR